MITHARDSHGEHAPTYPPSTIHGDTREAIVVVVLTLFSNRYLPNQYNTDSTIQYSKLDNDPTHLSSTTMSNRKVQFVIGNTYQRLPHNSAPYDRSGRYRKVHDWVLYFDVVSGNPDLISKVSFDLGASFTPCEFTSSCPIPVSRPNGTKSFRFQTRQQTYASVSATITITGAGGTRMVTTYKEITLQDAGAESTPQIFTELRPPRPLVMKKLSPSQRFGIELELTSPEHVDTALIGSLLNDKLRNTTTVTVVQGYRQGRQDIAGWKLVPDSSIVCSRSSPNCNTFELVSPVLEGGHGLAQVNKVLQALGQITGLKVNKSMGFHVHLDVSALEHTQLIKICQNFIKYEHVVDTLLPPSRRTGSEQCDNFFKSNRDAMRMRRPKDRHLALERCQDIDDLSALLNPNGRYYKLNLQNLVTGRQPTLEFRQHSATINYPKVAAWVRFCTLLVQNSASLKAPTPFKQGRTVDFGMDALFQYVIKDRALRDFYKGRLEELANEDDACCSGCAHGSACGKTNQ